MGDIPLTSVVVAVIFAFTFQIDGTNGLFFHTSRSFLPGASQPLSSEQERTNEDFRMPPFLPFFSFFRHRNPFMHVPLAEKNYDGLPSGKDEKSKINSTMTNKTKEVARIVENDADPLKNKTSNLPDPSVSRIINPLEEGPKISLLEPLPVYHFRRWRIESPELKKTDVQPSAATILSNATEEVDNFEGQQHHVLKKVINSGEEYGNTRFGKYPLGMVLNNSLMVDTENCTRRQFITRYFFVWTINWASLITHLTVILLITALVTCAFILCRPVCETGEQNTKFLKIKPLLV